MAQHYTTISLSAFLHSDLKPSSQFSAKHSESLLLKNSPTFVSVPVVVTSAYSASQSSFISSYNSSSPFPVTLQAVHRNGIAHQELISPPPKHVPLRRRYVSTPCTSEDYQPMTGPKESFSADTMWINSSSRFRHSNGTLRQDFSQFPGRENVSQTPLFRQKLISVNLRNTNDATSLYPHLFQTYEKQSQFQKLPMNGRHANNNAHCPDTPSIKRSKSFVSPPTPSDNGSVLNEFHSVAVPNLSESLEAAAACRVFFNEKDHATAFVESLSNLPMTKNPLLGIGRSQKLRSPTKDDTQLLYGMTAAPTLARMSYKSSAASGSPARINGLHTWSTGRKLLTGNSQASPLPPKPAKPASLKKMESKRSEKSTLKGNILSPSPRLSIVSSEGDAASDYCSDAEEDLISNASLTPTSGVETATMGGEDELAQLDDENVSDANGEDRLLEVDKMPLYDRNGNFNELHKREARMSIPDAEDDKEFSHLLPKHSIHVIPFFMNQVMKQKDECGLYSPVIPSLFPHTPPVIRFVPENERVRPFPKKYKKTIKWRMSSITPLVVKRAVARSGFSSTSNCSPNVPLIEKQSKRWIGYFGKHMKATGFRSILDHQKVNHFPGSFQIGRKDRLYRNLCRQRCQFGREEYDFFPLSYCLPSDGRQLKKIFEDSVDAGVKQKWIVKPPAAARGIGVKVISKWSQVPKRRPMIVQQYISKPYLIDGSKFDLRVYVYVSSVDPLRIYVYDNGLVRFASQPYSSSMKSLNNRFMHLTNYSVNKKNSKYTSNDDGDVCQGHKWTLKSLWTYLSKQGVDCDKLWSRIKDLVVKTIVAAESSVNSLVKMHVRRRGCVHEVFGFDVLLDKDLKPWILEVNISPSLHSNSPLDVQVKSSMISDMFNIAGFQIPPRECFSSKTNSEVNGLSLAHTSPSQIATSSVNVSSVSGSRTVPASPVVSYRGMGHSTTSNRAPLLKTSLSRPHSLEGDLIHLPAKSNSISGMTSTLPQTETNHVPAWESSQHQLDDTDESSDSDNSDEVESNDVTKESNSTSLKRPSYQSSTWCADLRLWDKSLAPDEKTKHAFYSQLKPTDKAMPTILDNLTADDVRMLCESVDEWSRAGAFERVFPLPADDGQRYLRFLQHPNRYYNCLLHQFLTRYQHKMDEGVALLYTLCQHKLHLNKNSDCNRWRPPV